MRSFRPSLRVLALCAAVTVPLPAGAQRHVRRPAPNAIHQSRATATDYKAANIGDYSLTIVSAVLPALTPDATSDMATLVIENRGTMTSPASLVSVAPRDHLGLARQSSIAPLAPGQRATIRVPVRIGQDGTECISITITDAPVPIQPAEPAAARFLATATPAPFLVPESMLAMAGLADADWFGSFMPTGY